jgi:hypothetical protein
LRLEIAVGSILVLVYQAFTLSAVELVINHDELKLMLASFDVIPLSSDAT